MKLDFIYIKIISFLFLNLYLRILFILIQLKSFLIVLKSIYLSIYFFKIFAFFAFNKFYNKYFFWKNLINLEFSGNKEDLLNFSKKINKKFVQKGIKLQSLGIYVRNFLKQKEIFSQSFNFCYLIIRFKRKNLFLTLLNNNGNVLCKTNIGSCGFKKKVKYTGYAIKRTSKRFSKKILGSFIKTLYIVRNQDNKKINRIKELLFIKKNYNIYNKIINVKKAKKNKIYINNKKIIKNINNKKFLRKKILKKKIKNKLLNYRNYLYIMKSIKKKFNIQIRIKSSFKFWGFRFIMYGLAKRFRWFNGIEVRLPIPHSNGLRLKKKRRV